MLENSLTHLLVSQKVNVACSSNAIEYSNETPNCGQIMENT